MKFTIYSSQFTINDQFSMTKQARVLNCKLKFENLMKIENCALKITTERSA